MLSRDPIGITEGSTAIAPQPTGRPLAVRPGSEYAVAMTLSERTRLVPPRWIGGAPATGAASAAGGAADASVRARVSRAEIAAAFDVADERSGAIVRRRGDRRTGSDPGEGARAA